MSPVSKFIYSVSHMSSGAELCVFLGMYLPVSCAVVSQTRSSHSVFNPYAAVELPDSAGSPTLSL